MVGLVTRRLLPAVLVLTACAGVPELFREPHVDLRQVTVRGVTLTGGTLDLALAVYNPNSFDLRGTDLRLGLEVEGSHVGDVTYTDAYSLQQGDTTVISLPLRFEWAGVGSALRTALESGEIPYTMRGEARLDTPLGVRAVPFSRTGRVPVARAAGAIPLPSGSR